MNNIQMGFNQEKIQSMNRTLILNLMRKEGVCSRVQLAKRSQLKQATITNMINDFIGWGLVKEVGLLTGNMGRRSIGISINNDNYGILAIRLARKNYSIGIYDLSGNPVILYRKNIDASQTPENTINKLLDDGTELIDVHNKDRKMIAIGVALPGPYNIKEERIEIMSGVAGWNKIPIKQRFEETFHLPVFVEQDANAGAMAQYWHMDEELQNEMLIYLALGQGIGAGIINNGEILRGKIGVAGEIGHISVDFNGPKCICGNRGCLENYCSSIAFTAMVNEAFHASKKISFSEAVVLLKSGNHIVKEQFLKVCDILSVGIVNIINTFNPSVVILGDEMSHIAPELMCKRVTENVKERLLPGIFEETKISISLAEQDSITQGSAITAITEVFSHPEVYFAP